MFSYSSWLSGTLATSTQRTAREQRRAAEAWQRINDKPLSITLKQASGTNRAAQVVRVESDNSATPGESAAGAAPTRKVIVFGIRNHATLPDTAIAEGDRFVYAGDLYTCVDIILQTGEVQGIFEANG